VYAQHLDNTGNRVWAPIRCCGGTAVNNQTSRAIRTDGGNGAIIAWQDFRNGTNTGYLSSQRVNAAGTVQWTADGQVLCNTANVHRYLAILFLLRATVRQLYGSTIHKVVAAWWDYDPFAQN